MKECANIDCEELAVFLESSCWNHLDDQQRTGYPGKLIDEMKERKAVSSQNFRRVALIGVSFDEYAVFNDCDFSGADLAKSSLRRADLQGSNFDHSVLNGCHFENADMRGITTTIRYADVRESHFDGALLQNVNFTGSDLRDATFVGADMVGAMLSEAKLYSSRLIETRIRKESFCNFSPTSANRIRLGDEKKYTGMAIPCTPRGGGPLDARFVYTSLKNNFRSIGEYDDERWAHMKEQEMERKRLYDLAFLGDRDADAIARERWFPQDLNQRFESRSKALGKWVISWVPYVFGYGEKLKNIFMLSVIVIIICSFLFMFQGFELSRFGEGENINRDLSFQAFELRGTFRDWFLSLYMSVITFSTLGYGDARPVGLTRVVASMEALTGLVLMGFFVAILARKIIRG